MSPTQETSENFIPFQKTEVLEMCSREGSLRPEQQANFRDFCHILEGYYHFKHFELTEKLKRTYFPFNPDRDTKTKINYTPEELAHLKKEFLETLTSVLKKANYEEVSREELDQAMLEKSLFNISLEVDFDDFEQFLIFKRGEHPETIEIKKFGFLKKQINMIDYERVVLYIQFKNAEYFKQKGKQLVFEPSSTILKLFKNIPKADIEMLFPNAETKMSQLDKIFMGLPAGIGAVPVLMKVIPSLFVLGGIVLTTLGVFEAKQEDPNQMKAAVQGLLGLGILGGFLFRQWVKYKNKKLAFAKALTDNLYFKNLDNNVGVFHQLIDAAEEEECKEAILAYYFLITTPQPMTEKQLDERIEQWFMQQHQIKIDFEVDDALHKLKELGISQHKDGLWTALSLEQAKERIDYLWDNIFSYNNVSH